MSEDLIKPKLDRWDVLAERIERLCEDLEQLISEHRMIDARVRALEVSAAVSNRNKASDADGLSKIENQVKALELAAAETRGGLAAAKTFGALLGGIAGIVVSLIMKMLGKG